MFSPYTSVSTSPSCRAAFTARLPHSTPASLSRAIIRRTPGSVGERELPARGRASSSAIAPGSPPRPRRCGRPVSGMVMRDRASAAATRSPSPARSCDRLVSRADGVVEAARQLLLARVHDQQLGPLLLGSARACRSARAYCAAASRWANACDARRRRPGVLEHRVVVAASSAWCARRDESPVGTSARRISACSARRRCGATPPRPRDGRARGGTPRLHVGAEHTGREAGVELRELTPGRRLEQPQLGARRDHRDDLEQRRAASPRSAMRASTRLEPSRAARRRPRRGSPSRRRRCPGCGGGSRHRRHVRRRELAHGFERKRRDRQSHHPGADASSPRTARSGCRAATSSSR